MKTLFAVLLLLAIGTLTPSYAGIPAGSADPLPFDESILDATTVYHISRSDSSGHQAKFQFELPISSYVMLKIYDAAGKEVATLANGIRDAGENSIVWKTLPEKSGVYYYTMSTIALNDPFPRYRTAKKIIVD